MGLIEAKCTNCGGVLSVSRDKDAMVCPYCGSAFIVEKAIQNFNNTYNIIAKNVIIEHREYKDFDIRDGVLVKYNGRSENIRIPDGVTKIQRDAFEDIVKNNIHLKQLVIPGSMKTFDIVDMRYDSWNFPRGDEIILCEGVEYVYTSVIERTYEKIILPSSIKKIYPRRIHSNVVVRKKEGEGWLRTLRTFIFPNNKNTAMKQLENYYNLKCPFCGGNIKHNIFKIYCDNCNRKLDEYYVRYDSEGRERGGVDHFPIINRKQH